MHNNLVYNDISVVSSYSRFNHLLKAEQQIFAQYKEDLSRAQLLDIGVGGGRTTAYLSKNCAHYTGIDYSEAMVLACQQRFPHLDFKVHDAAKMESFVDATFDFAFFSFNGIDCVDLSHRELIFKEVNRVLKPRGKFIFSFHNALSLDHLYSYLFPKNPLNWFKEYHRINQLKKLNGPKERYYGLDFFKLYDGAEDFRMEVMYLKPSFQLDMLQKQNFRTLSCWNAHSGTLIPTSKVDESKCFWIYVVCEAL